MTLSFEQARNLITATRTRRRYSHSLPGYLAFVLALVILLPSAAVLGIATCAGTVVTEAAAHHAHAGPAFTPQPIPGGAPAAGVYYGGVAADGSLVFSSRPIGPPVRLDRGGFAHVEHAGR
jgi:hypothetical protein